MLKRCSNACLINVFSWFSGKPLDYYRNLRDNPSNYLLFVIGSTKLSVLVRESGVSPGSVVTIILCWHTSRGRWGWSAVAADLVEDQKKLQEPDGGSRAKRYWAYCSNGSISDQIYGVEFFRYVMHLFSGQGNYFLDWLPLRLWGNPSSWDRSGAPQIRAMVRIYEAEKKRQERLWGYWLSLCDGGSRFCYCDSNHDPQKWRLMCRPGRNRLWFDRWKWIPETVNKAKSMTRIGEEGCLLVDNYDSFYLQFSPRKIWWGQVLRNRDDRTWRQVAQKQMP